MIKKKLGHFILSCTKQNKSGCVHLLGSVKINQTKQDLKEKLSTHKTKTCAARLQAQHSILYCFIFRGHKPKKVGNHRPPGTCRQVDC